MRRVYQLSGAGCVAFSIWVIVESRNLDYWIDIGPGPGFFPFWLGMVFAVLSGLWLGQVSLRPVEGMDEDFIPDRAGIVRIASIMVAVAVYGLFVDVIGFQLITFAFLLLMLMALGRQNLLITLAISILGSFGVYYVFRTWLDVMLPASSIQFLQQLGL